MGKDMTVQCDNGIINVRVGAIILQDGKVLMVSNKRNDYFYSVGGRIQFGETAEQAIVREVLEETGVEMEIDRLGFVHENYFYGDSPANLGKIIYELSFYFYMKVPKNFVLTCNSFTEDGSEEYLTWVSPDEKTKLFPAFFKTELNNPKTYVRHVVTDER
ncbi:MAG: NUDIX domain-containing protein [Clostridiales bacterium]|nr:NUDIX domain-containing protein [Clostridiales bacterium]